MIRYGRASRGGKDPFKVEVLNRITGTTQFIAEIDCDDDVSEKIKIGLAVTFTAAKEGTQ